MSLPTRWFGLALVLMLTLPLAACGRGGNTQAGSDIVFFAFAQPTTDQEAQRAVAIMRKRAAGLGIADASVELVNRHIVLKFTPSNGHSHESIVTELSRPGRLLFRPVLDKLPAQGNPPTNLPSDDNPTSAVVLPQKGANGEVSARYSLGPAQLSGDAIKDASASKDFTGNWLVDFTMTSSGAVQFDQLAARNYQRQVALDFDGEVKSAPQINAQQFNGRGQVTGAFTQSNAEALAVILRFGSLPNLIVVKSVNDNPSTSVGSAPAPTTPLTTMATVGGTAPAGCPPPDGSAQRFTQFQAAPPECINPAKQYTATIATSEGTMKIALNPHKAPVTVNNFVVLARYHFYDGLTFHRVVRNFVIQGGDPVGDGSGGPGYTFKDELPAPGEYKIGSVAMANAGPDTNGSQFFIITGQQGVQLPPNYTLFGQVTSGMDVAQKIESLADAGSPNQKPSRPVTINTITISES